MSSNGTVNGTVEVKATGTEPLPPSIICKDPVTGVETLFVRPEYAARPHKQFYVRTEDTASFAAAVRDLKGDNPLVMFDANGVFRYHNELGAARELTVGFDLKAHPTAKVLCLDHGLAFTQRELVEWHAQWSDTLVPIMPDGTAPEAAWEAVQKFSLKGTKSVDVEHGDNGLTVAVDVKDALPLHLVRLWKAKSPVFDGHEEQKVTLRLDVVAPEADLQTGKVVGDLRFAFRLWTPAASEITNAAREQACEAMAEALGDEFVVIRGQLGGQQE